MPNPDKLDDNLPTTKPRAQAPVAKAAEPAQPRKPPSLLPKLSMFSFRVPSDVVDTALGLKPPQER